MSDDNRQIELRRHEWIAAVNGRDMQRYLELLTDDIVWFPPGQSAFQGKRSFESWLRPFFKSFSYRFTVSDVVLKVAGGWAIERGAFKTEMAQLPEGESMQHAGKYMLIWRKSDNGSWCIERYIDES